VSFNETLGIEVVDEKGKTCGSTLTYAYFVSFIFFCSFLVKILLKSNLRLNLVRSHLESKKTTSEAEMGVIRMTVRCQGTLTVLLTSWLR
jgi:hypothetical protein